jgi:protein TonB
VGGPGGLGGLGAVACALLLAGCGQTPAPAPQPAPPSAATPAAPKPAPGPAVTARPVLPPAGKARDWNEFKRQAALRLVAANPGRTYDGPVPEPLLAIPVLEIELESDGRVRGVRVMRHPSQAKDTTQLAIDAVHRAAPFGYVGHLPRPWKFAEVFLFDDHRRFKPRTLDE